MFDKESDIKVYVTENYSIFNFLESNRAVNQNQVKKIVKSIQAKGYYPVPILVDDKVGDKGYVSSNLYSLQDDLKNNVALIREISRICYDDVECFSCKAFGTIRSYGFFLPLDAVKADEPKEKKYRPLKSIDEMDCLFDCSVMSAKNFITYRSKVTGEIYIELLFAVSRDKNDVLSSINNIPVQDLFNNFEIRKNGEWLPFGIKVEEDE